MPKNYPFISGFSFALKNFRAKDLLYWSFWLALVNIGGAIVEHASGYSFWNYALSNLGKAEFDFSYLLISWSITFAALLVSLYVSARAMMSAMRISKVKTAKGIDFLKWVWLQIYKLALNLACWYDKKLLLPAVVLAAFAGAAYVVFPDGISILAAFPIFFLAVLAWEAAFMIHATRTSFSVYMFLEGEKSAGKVVKKSDGMVKGQTVEVFAAQLFAMAALLIPLLAINYLTGEGIGKIAGADLVLASAMFAIAAILSIFTLALQQALSANIWAFFEKAK